MYYLEIVRATTSSLLLTVIDIQIMPPFIQQSKLQLLHSASSCLPVVSNIAFLLMLAAIILLTHSPHFLL